jgi:glycosyltransferase involved in cell wall biosynthesis
MRILLVHSRYSKFGGGENYVSSLRELLEQNGNTVFLFSFDNDRHWKNEREFIYQDNFYPGDRNPFRLVFYYIMRFYLNPVLVVRLRKWIKTINPEIIHIHANDRYGISVLLAIKNLGIPIVQSFHANDALCLSNTFKKPDGTLCKKSLGISCLNQNCMPFSKFLAMVPSYIIRNQLTKKNVKGFTTSNKILKERLEKNDFTPVIHLPLFVWDNNNDSNPESGNIFCPGTHLEQKGFQYLIRAMTRIIRCFPESVLHIAGRGPFTDNLVRLASEIGMDNHIIFHGYLETSDISLHYKESSVVVFPSTFLEVSPLVVLDAMASGRPVIGSNISGIEEFFNEEEIGFLVDPTDPEQISRAVCRVLNDINLGKKLGENGRYMFEHKFSPDIHYKNIMSYYQSIQDTFRNDRMSKTNRF